MGIPVIDLRATDPLGEPLVLLKPTTPKQKINYSKIAGGIVWTVWITFLIILVILIIYLFGVLAGLGIVLFGLGKILS